MSTDLYGVRVLEVDPEHRRLKLQVIVVYYDTAGGYHQEIPYDRSFFFRTFAFCGAFDEDLGENERYDEAWVDRNTFRFIEEFRQLSVRNDPIEDYAGYADFYFVGENGWIDEEKLAQAEFDVFVTKKAYLSKFSVGQFWGTTAYCTDSDPLTADDYDHIPNFEQFTSFSPFTHGSGAPDYLTFSPDGEFVAISDYDGNINVVVSSTNTICASLRSHDRSATSLGWFKGELVFRSELEWRRHNLENNETAKLDGVWGFDASGDATRFTSGFGDDRFVVYDDQRNELFVRPKVAGDHARTAFDRDGRMAVVAIESDDVRIVDLATGSEHTFAMDPCSDVGMSPDGRYVVAVNYHGVQIRDNRGRLLRFVALSDLTSCTWSRDGSYILIGGRGRSIEGQPGYRVYHYDIGHVADARLDSAQLPLKETVGLAEFVESYVQLVERWPRLRSRLDDELVSFHVALIRQNLTDEFASYIGHPGKRVIARAHQIYERGKRGENLTELFDVLQVEMESMEIDSRIDSDLFASMAIAAVSHDEPTCRQYLDRAMSTIPANDTGRVSCVVANAFVACERLDDAETIIRNTSVAGPHHLRLLEALLVSDFRTLADLALDRWEFDSSAMWILPSVLLKHDAVDFAPTLGWSSGSARDRLDVWRRWIDKDPRAAALALVDAPDGPEKILLQRLIEPGTSHEIYDDMMSTWSVRTHFVEHLFDEFWDLGVRAWSELPDEPVSSFSFAPTERVQIAFRLAARGKDDHLAALMEIDSEMESTVALLGLHGHWSQAFERTADAPRVERNRLWTIIVRAAVQRGDLYVARHALNRLPSTEYDAWAIQETRRTIRSISGVFDRSPV